MKKILLAILIAVQCYGCGNTPSEESQTGSIYGVITDKATGEPVRAAGVLLNPVGTTAITGDEGQYEFPGLEPGGYTIQVTKTGYADLTGHSITVVGGKTNKGDVQLQLLPPSLRVTNNDKQDIVELDFGDAEADVSRSFNIFNDGVATLEWEITETSEWITKLSQENGALSAGATHAVIITIDREKLSSGANSTTIHVTSNNGSKQLSVKATNNSSRASLNTLDVSNISASSATFNGKITSVGRPSYTERGFVYSQSSMPTLESSIAKLTAPVTSTTEYSANATGLTLGTKYYVRAYAINSAGTAYSSNEVSFQTMAVVPVVTTQAVSNINTSLATFNGIVVNVGDPAYTERGFVYGSSQNPSIETATKISVIGNGMGAFSVNITGLNEGVLYYVRAYAIGYSGVVYGEPVTFIPESPYYHELRDIGLHVAQEDASSSHVNFTAAKSLCANSSLGGFTDWRLPTIDELSSLYGNKYRLKNLTLTYYHISPNTKAYYWSSSRDYEVEPYNSGVNCYFTLAFLDGSQSFDRYDNRLFVRCVRSLP